MEKEFLLYEEALALKEIDFDEPCFAYFLNGNLVLLNKINFEERTNSNIKKLCYGGSQISAPLYQQAFRWFREKYDLDGRVISWLERGKIVWYYSTEPVGKPSRFKPYESTSSTPEEADLACLRKLIEIVKNKNPK